MYEVIKSHKVVSGETSSSVKCDTYKDALRQYHKLAANYLDDASVLAWSLSIVESNPGAEMKMMKRESYVEPVEPVEPVEEETVVS